MVSYWTFGEGIASTVVVLAGGCSIGVAFVGGISVGAFVLGCSAAGGGAVCLASSL